MKKLLALVMTLIMICSLCGCFGGSIVDDVRGEINNGDTQQNASAQPEFSLGETADNTYTNEFLGISCTLPSDWIFYTDAQILELNNIAGDMIDEEIAKQLENSNVIYDMYATNIASGNSVNVTLEKLSAVQLISLDIKQTLEGQIDTIKSSFQSMGYTDVNVAYQKTTVNGKDFDSLKITAKIQGMNFYSTAFAFRKGNYIANVTVATLLNDNTSTLLNYFTVK